jgi:predicted transcriptional regulator
MRKVKVQKTSLEAFRSLDPDKISAIHKRILAGLETIGSGTYEDLATLLNLEPQRVWRRLSELGKANLIHRPGERKMLKSGRQGMVWKLGGLPETTKKKERVMKGKSVHQFAKDILSIHQERLF